VGAALDSKDGGLNLAAIEVDLRKEKFDLIAAS
jgi:hypothetical protein